MSTRQTYKRKDDKKVSCCAKCQKTIELSNFAEQAHMKGKKRIKNAETIQCLTTMKYQLFICQIRHKCKQTKLKKLIN